MRFTAKYFLISLLFMGFLACESSTAPKPEFLFKASMLVKENHTWYKAFKYFGELLSERSGGRMKLQVYPSEQLAKEL